MPKKPFFKKGSAAPVIITVIVLVAMLAAVIIFHEKAENHSEPAVSPAPVSPSPSPTISPASETPALIQEDGNAPMSHRAAGTYKNTQVFSCITGYGMRLSVGLNNEPVSDAIYLNPQFTYDYAGNPYEQYGFFIKSDRVPVQYSDTRPEPASAPKNEKESNLLILGRTYDKVVPAACIGSDSYGARWQDSDAYGGGEHNGDILYIRVIRLSDGTLMGVARIVIDYDTESNAYYISNVYNCDVGYTGEIDLNTRADLIARAIAYIKEGNSNMTVGYSSDDNWTGADSAAIVECLPRVYFNRLFNADGEAVAAGKFAKCDIVAVNIPYAGIGFFTVYFAPEAQANGMSLPTVGNNALEYVIIGYDAFAPFTVDIFNSFLFPDDVAKFGADQY